MLTNNVQFTHKLEAVVRLGIAHPVTVMKLVKQEEKMTTPPEEPFRILQVDFILSDRTEKLLKLIGIPGAIEKNNAKNLTTAWVIMQYTAKWLNNCVMCKKLE